MKYYRITKYNPKYRDINDYYTLNEWTSFSDIGINVDGKILTKNEYLSVENNYLYAVKLILKKYKNKFFFIKDLFPYFSLEEVKGNFLIETKEIVSYLLKKINDSKLFNIDINNVLNNISNKYIKKITYFGPNEFDKEKKVQIQYLDSFIFDIKCFDNIFRLLIRELIPGSKIFIGRSYIYFGYDMYIYVYTKNGIFTKEIIDKLNKKGLYIEEIVN